MHNGIAVGLLPDIRYHFHIDCIFNQNHASFPSAFGCFPLRHALRSNHFCVRWIRQVGPMAVKGRVGFVTLRMIHVLPFLRLAAIMFLCSVAFCTVLFPHDCKIVLRLSGCKTAFKPTIVLLAIVIRSCAADLK